MTIDNDPVSPGANRARSSTGPASGPAAKHHWQPNPEQLKIWQKNALDDEKLCTKAIQKSFCHHATKTLARSSFNMDDFAAYQSVAHSIRDRLLERWNATQVYTQSQDPKRVYYLSLEFLLGRTLDNAMLAMGVKDEYKTALDKLGFSLDGLIEEEEDAALGNGGLGRLAACYMDSLATCNYPAWYFELF
jgi:starch phosphorylase